MANKKLNLQELQRIQEQTFPKKRLVVEFGDNQYTILIKNKFKDSDIDKMLEFVIEDMDRAKQEKVDVGIFVLSNLAFVKAFTDLVFGETLENEILMLEYLSDLDILNKIMKQFTEQDLERIYTYLRQKQENLPKIIKEMKIGMESVTKTEEEIQKVVEE